MRRRPVVLEFQRGQPWQRPLFLAPSFTGTAIGWWQVVHHLDPGLPVYGLDAHGLWGDRRPYRRIETMAASYLREIRRRWAGPVMVAGYCFGGVIAYEMGRQLIQNGSEPALVVAVDAMPYSPRQHCYRQIRSIKDATSAALASYATPAAGVKLTLIVSAVDPDAWIPIALGGIDVQRIEVNHLELLQEGAEEVARAIALAVEGAI